ncbi:MAG TPA: DMT family transporter [Polyangia bacterium]|nr:DMT family transporter [Polyangia bacterium]
MSSTNLRGRGLAAVLAGASLVGLSAIFVKWAVAGGATILTVGFYRMAFALPFVLGLARRTGGTGDAAGRRWAIAGSVMFSLDLALWHAAMGRTTAANATLLVGGLSPIWVALYSALILGRRYRALGWLGQATGLAGALVLALARGARVGDGSGEALAVLASFCYAAFTLAFSRSRRSIRAPEALLWMSLTCLVCFAVFAIAARHPFAGYDRRAWLSLAGLGLIVQLAGWWLNSWGLGHVDAALGAIGLQMQQVATPLLAAWLLAEPLRPLGLLGGALIVGGIVMVAAGATRAPA